MGKGSKICKLEIYANLPGFSTEIWWLDCSSSKLKMTTGVSNAFPHIFLRIIIMNIVPEKNIIPVMYANSFSGEYKVMSMTFWKILFLFYNASILFYDIHASLHSQIFFGSQKLLETKKWIEKKMLITSQKNPSVNPHSRIESLEYNFHFWQRFPDLVNQEIILFSVFVSIFKNQKNISLKKKTI